MSLSRTLFRPILLLLALSLGAMTTPPRRHAT